MYDGSVIAAVATGAMPGSVGVIRISGKETFSVVEKVFFPVDGRKKLSEAAGYTALYGRIMDGDEVIDDGIALVFREPRSFTGENTVELSLHGGRYVLLRAMEALIRAGARQAGPGEFTKRAFMNGKMDLTAAAAVMETVSARGEMQLREAGARRRGEMFRKISALRERITELCAHAAAWCDFPDEDVEELTGERALEELEEIRNGISRMTDCAHEGISVAEGVRAVICGRPNVGKSTVMNLLSREERSIVTPVAGTTRDVVESAVNVKGITLLLADTAGIRETADPVEKLGVERSKSRAEDAAFLLGVFDVSAEPEEDDILLLESMAGRPGLILLNKKDLGIDPGWKETVEKTGLEYVTVSASDSGSRETVADGILAALSVTGEELDGGILATARELEAAQRALSAAEDAIAAVKAGYTPDLMAVCLEDALSALGEITGETASESVIEKVFENFCVGK